MDHPVKGYARRARFHEGVAEHLQAELHHKEVFFTSCVLSAPPTYKVIWVGGKNTHVNGVEEHNLPKTVDDCEWVS